VSDVAANRPFPRGALIGAGSAIALALLAAIAGRLTGSAAEPPATAAVVAHDLRFEDRPDGGVTVYDASDVQLVAIIAPGSNGFLRGTLRGFARERKRDEIGAQPPFRLTAWADGRLTLEDRSTGRHVELEAFGPTNEAVFARLLTAKGDTQ
jgi:putative photosynthetic complex assembly protein